MTPHKKMPSHGAFQCFMIGLKQTRCIKNVTLKVAKEIVGVPVFRGE